ncbi:MAG TPA: terminase TerL endonuclease subunit [Gaiellaceae bacterium]|nr:terminase TerL endonuclease subunit [Gaiellaceae bacterium]
MTLGPRETLRYFAESLAGIELNPGQSALVDLIDGRVEDLREIVVRKGRRIGMTMTASLVAAWYGTVLAPRLREHVMNGEDFRIALVATSRDQASLMLRFIKNFLKQSPMLAEQIVSETADSLRLVSGCEIVASVCSARAHRGWPNALVIIDEAAHYVDSEGNMSLASLLEALRPSQAQFGSLALLLAISTPLDAAGTFFELEQQAASGQFPDIAALHLPTVEARPELEPEAERTRLLNPRSYEREYIGNYTSGEESFPIHLYDACVDPDYAPPEADPGRAVVLGLDGAVSKDAMALVGIDGSGALVYARAWYPPPGGTIDHRAVLIELIELGARFAVQAIAYDPSQIHMLVMEALRAGLPMLSVSQAAGRTGGTMARHTAALIEALHARQVCFYPCPELREHLANARFNSRSGGDRLVKASPSKKIDLAVALTMAIGVLYDIGRERLLRPEEVYEVVSAHDYLVSQGIRPTDLSSESQAFGGGFEDVLGYDDLDRDWYDGP